MWTFFFFSSRRRHTRSLCDWSSDVCSSDIENPARHRAFGDALATAHVLRALIGRARKRGVETLEQLIEVHERPRHAKMRNSECGMRNVSGEVDPRANSHVNSAFRIPHSEF